MQRFMIASVFSLLGSLILGLPASACINDSTVYETEKEFKSQYLDQLPDVSPGEESADPNMYILTTAGTGGGLLIGAVLMGFFMQSRKRPEIPPSSTESAAL